MDDYDANWQLTQIMLVLKSLIRSDKDIEIRRDSGKENVIPECCQPRSNSVFTSYPRKIRATRGSKLASMDMAELEECVDLVTGNDRIDPEEIVNAFSGLQKINQSLNRDASPCETGGTMHNLLINRDHAC